MFLYRVFLVSLLIIVASLSNAIAQDKPAGKFSGYMFGDYFYNAARDTAIAGMSNVATGGAKDLNGFQFRRIYFAYDNDISSTFMTRFRLEVDQAALSSNGKISTFVKDAYLRWKNVFNGSDLFFGIQPTPAFDISEAAWGYRSLEKTIMDLRGIVSSRDIAVALKGKLDDEAKYNYWVMVGNGSGNSPESDKYKRFYANLQLKPIDNLQLTLYGDLKAQPAIDDPNSATTPKATLSNHVMTSALFVGYGEKDKYNFGFEGFMQTTQNGIKKGTAVPYEMKGKTALGLSFFASYNFQPDLAVVGRFDYFDPNSDGDFKGDSRNYILAGLSWKPDKNVSVMPNIQVETYEKIPGVGGAPDKTFDASVTPRITFYYIFL